MQTLARNTSPDSVPLTLHNHPVNKYADGAKADLLTVGAKATYVPFHHCYLFIAPEFDIVIKKDNKYNSAAEKAGFTKGGFVLHAGVLVNF